MGTADDPLSQTGEAEARLVHTKTYNLVSDIRHYTAEIICMLRMFQPVGSARSLCHSRRSPPALQTTPTTSRRADREARKGVKCLTCVLSDVGDVAALWVRRRKFPPADSILYLFGFWWRSCMYAVALQTAVPLFYLSQLRNKADS